MTQHPVHLNLKTVQCWEIQLTWQRLLQWLIVLIVKNFPLVSNWNLPRSNLNPLSLIFSM